MKYYAHSPKGNIPAQEYAEHVLNVRERAVKYARDAGQYSIKDGDLLVRIADMASVFHDLGKLDKENQSVLSGEIKAKSLPKNHVDAGTAHFLHEDKLLAAISIYAHHLGLPDFIEESNRESKIFRDSDLMDETDKLLSSFERIHTQLIHSSFHTKTDMPQGDLQVFLRMLLSCLSDADHTDSAVNYGRLPKDGKIVTLHPLQRLEKLNQYVETLGDNSERSLLRHKMYFDCLNADISQNIASCDSPVGSGKTTAVMAHLLTQAAKRGLRRIFVILPYTNIIRQSVETYRKALTLPGEKAIDVVAELHHRADFENEDARHLTALWRAPIIVTTAVAFFETLASNTTATLRRLHELPGSAIFVDESHAALPARLLPLAWRWINIYADEWKNYWVLASGSLSRFWHIPEISQNIQNGPVPEIVNDNLRESLSTYENGRISYKSELQPKNVNELLAWISGFPGPRLVILNTIQSAAVLADAFARQFGREKVEHLSTALTPVDREKTLDRIKKRLSDKYDIDWILIATSCVEAGVDFSFKSGFRELGSLVSLLQAAGRINRGGENANAEIWTFRLALDGILIENPGMKTAAEILQGYFERGEEISPALSTQSIKDEIRLGGVKTIFEELLSLENNKRFPHVEDKFKVIDSNTRIVVVNENVAIELENGEIDWQELQKNSVQIVYYKLKQLGTQEIIPNIYRWNLLYDDFLGYMAGIIQIKKLDNQSMII